MRQKLNRFKVISTRENIVEPQPLQDGKFRGKWGKEFFKNDHPIVLELGCGRGEYTVGLARLFPDKNFIGVDVKGDRIFVGSTVALEENLSNVAFLRVQVQQLESHFEKEEVDEIWLTFPDPRPKLRDTRRRLTSPRFMQMYQNILKPEGVVHLKTDNTPLFDYTREIIKELSADLIDCTEDLYHSSLNQDHFSLKTRFEEMFYNQGFNIKYLKFKFR